MYKQLEILFGGPSTPCARVLCLWQNRCSWFAFWTPCPPITWCMAPGPRPSGHQYKNHVRSMWLL